jgi:2-polyprenyl-3-methyl-5-hydroxy-6-metoxy-1,4-benzoquinol methylase
MGIEISKKLIDQAGQLNAGEERQMRFKVFDGKNIPADIQGYELVYMIDVLHHIPLNAQQDFLSALCEKMASGAALVLKDIDAGSPLVIFNKIHDLIFAGETGHERSVSLTKKMLMQAGFQLNEQFNIRTLVYPHTFFICSRP